MHHRSAGVTKIAKIAIGLQRWCVIGCVFLYSAHACPVEAKTPDRPSMDATESSQSVPLAIKALTKKHPGELTEKERRLLSEYGRKEVSRICKKLMRKYKDVEKGALECAKQAQKVPGIKEAHASSRAIFLDEIDGSGTAIPLNLEADPAEDKDNLIKWAT